MLRNFRLLARLRVLRGTPFDVFGYTAERKMERALIRQYEKDMATWLHKANSDTMDALVALAELPLQIRGFGPVKLANAQKAAQRRDEILSSLGAGAATLAKAAE
jgi:indolepyruvate ferredoxin oxidoreductase